MTKTYTHQALQYAAGIALTLLCHAAIAQVAATSVAASDTLFAKVQIDFFLPNGNGAFRVVRDSTPLTCLVGGTDQIQSVDDRAGTANTTYSYTVRTYAPGDYGCTGPYQTSAADNGIKLAATPATNVNASNGANQVQVTWTPGVGMGQAVLRDGVSQTRCLAGNAATWTDLEATPGTSYSYKIRTYSGEACSEGFVESTSDSGDAIAAPAVPGGVSATDGTLPNKVRVTWTAVANATSYTLSYANGAGGAKQAVATGVTATSSDVTGPGVATMRYYSVQACNTAGCSPSSAEDAGFALPPPSTPTNIVATDGTAPNTVRVTWNTGASATSYTLSYATRAGGAKTEVVTGVTGNSYDVTNVTSATLRYYSVQACNAAGCSPSSVEDSGYPLLAPNTPAGVSASDGTSDTTVTVTWQPMPTAQSYNVAIAVARGATKNTIATNLTGTSHKHTGSNDRLYYSVQACNAAGCSGWSNEDLGYIYVAPPVAELSNHEGLWWNSAESGWGINFEHQDNMIFATWFTYDATGKPWWLIAELDQGDTNTFTGPVSTVTGPAFGATAFDPRTVVENVIGTMTVSFADDNHATLRYTVNGITQVKEITPQVFGVAPTCLWGIHADLSATTNYQGLWWNPQEAGWGINLSHQGNTIFATWFIYDDENKSTWLIGQFETAGGGVFTGKVSTVSGQPFNASPWDMSHIKETVVGAATLTFSHGNAGTLAYNVNGITGSKAITRQVFAAPGTVCMR